MGAIAGLKTDSIIDGQHLVFRICRTFGLLSRYRGSLYGMIVFKRVIAPGQLEDNQHRVFGIRCHRVSSLCL